MVDRKDIDTRAPLTDGGSNTSSGSSGQFPGYERKSFSSATRAADIAIPDARFVAGSDSDAPSTEGRFRSTCPLSACIITDGFSIELTKLIENLYMELGTAGGSVLHYYNLGNPLAYDEIYQASLNTEDVAAIKESAKAHGERVAAAADNIHLVQEMKQLARKLGVDGEKLPLLVVFNSDTLNIVTTAPIHQDAANEASWSKAIGRLLCTRLTETLLSERFAIGQEALKEYLDSVLAPLQDLDRLGLFLRDNLSLAQVLAYERHNYQTHVEIHFTGNREDGRDLIMVDRKPILLSINQLEMMLSLAACLMENGEGWVPDSEVKDGVKVIARYSNQDWGRLRDKLAAAVADPTLLVETDNAGSRRLSTHPDFITYDRYALLENSSGTVRELAAGLPSGP